MKFILDTMIRLIKFILISIILIILSIILYYISYWSYILITDPDTFWLEVEIWGKR